MVCIGEMLIEVVVIVLCEWFVCEIGCVCVVLLCDEFVVIWYWCVVLLVVDNWFVEVIFGYDECGLLV